jgi:hypothetical protein
MRSLLLVVFYKREDGDVQRDGLWVKVKEEIELVKYVSLQLIFIEH